jgi:hypothetical protein
MTQHLALAIALATLCLGLACLIWLAERTEAMDEDGGPR